MRHNEVIFTFQDVAKGIGDDAADALVAKHGGTTLTIPATLAPAGETCGGGTAASDRLRAAIGEPAARVLVKLLGKGSLYIPMQSAIARRRRNALIVAEFDRLTAGIGGITARAACALLAREFTLADATIWRIIKRGAGG